MNRVRKSNRPEKCRAACANIEDYQPLCSFGFLLMRRFAGVRLQILRSESLLFLVSAAGLAPLGRPLRIHQPENSSPGRSSFEK